MTNSAPASGQTLSIDIALEWFAERAPRTWRVFTGIARVGARIRADERFFLLALTAFNLYLARRTFDSGIWADNDSVCHYAYLRHLLEDFYPATGTFMGWTPRFNLGTPFLVYNTPPGLYVASAIVAKTTGMSALLALKCVVVSAFIAVPLVGAAFARTLDDTRNDLPKFVALAMSLFTSELFGLEFYCRNGMLNPAVALPLAIATLVFYRHAQMAVGLRVLRFVALAATAFAATAFVHLLTAYMLALTLGVFALADGLRTVGRGLVLAGAVAALGAALIGFWLVPSLPFAAKTDAAYTWIRPPLDTLSSYVDGSVLSSYFVGFYPQFFQFSASGLVAILCAAFGVVFLFFHKNTRIGACFGALVLMMLITIGPQPSYGLWILPMYDRLLWYRFMTFVELLTFVLAGWGAFQIWRLRAKLGRTVIAAFLIGGLWAAGAIVQRSGRIQTADANFPLFVADVEAVSGWLREHGDPRGRVYSEFLGQNVIDSASVNYARHMIPLLSGLSEASGWVYENNEAAQAFLKRGLLWYNPFPMIALGEHYDVQYVVAGSPNFARALRNDPRWREVLGTRHLTLFEAQGRMPSLIEAPGWTGEVTSQGYLRGGGYEYVIRAEPTGDGAHASSMVVRTSWSPAWKATSGKQGELRVGRTDDGLLTVELPAAATPTDVTLTWEIGALRTKGNRLSAFAFLVAALLVALGARDASGSWTALTARAADAGGVVAAAGFLTLGAVRGKPIDPSYVGFGIAGGMTATYDATRVDVGSFDDAERFRLTRVEPAGWGVRSLRGSAPTRELIFPEHDALGITLSPAGSNRITIRGFVRGEDGVERDDSPVDLVFVDPSVRRIVCRVSTALGRPTLLPPACSDGDRDEFAPGVTRAVRIETAGTFIGVGADVDAGLVVVEAESMHNVLDDSSFDAFYALGPPDQLASNGVSVIATPEVNVPIAIAQRVPLPAPRYEAWIRTRAMSERFSLNRGHLHLVSDGVAVGDASSLALLPFWEDKVYWGWVRVGNVVGGKTRTIRITFYRPPDVFSALTDLDSIVFVPTGSKDESARVLEPSLEPQRPGLPEDSP